MTQIQLSDTQAIILSAACARDNGCLLPVTASLKGGAVNMVLNSLLKKGLAEEIPAGTDEPAWREDEDGTPLTLRATPAAYQALGIVADTAQEAAPATDMAGRPETPPAGAHSAPEAQPVRKTREGTKQEALITMLRQPLGASIVEIARECLWAPHTVRGALAGALKKKLGLKVTSEKHESRGRVYRIID
jgi:hypothetical protein